MDRVSSIGDCLCLQGLLLISEVNLGCDAVEAEEELVFFDNIYLNV